MALVKLTKRAVDACKSEGKRHTVWDTEVAGFGLRVTPSGERSYVLKYRHSGQQRWFNIGRHGSPWTPEMARREAQRLLGEVTRGIDPASDKQADRDLRGRCQWQEYLHASCVCAST